MSKTTDLGRKIRGVGDNSGDAILPSICELKNRQSICKTMIG